MTRSTFTSIAASALSNPTKAFGPKTKITKSIFTPPHLFKKTYSTTPGISPNNRYSAAYAKLKTLAVNKLGYPVSLASSQGNLDLTSLGIKKDSLANIFINNLGSPWTTSETWQMEVKEFEKEIFEILGHYFKVPTLAGYVTSGGTEANLAGIWWAKRRLIIAEEDNISALSKMIQTQSQSPQTSQDISQLNLVIKNYKVLHDITHPILIYTRHHTHYSVNKISDILQLNTLEIDSSAIGEMNLEDLEYKLKTYLLAHPNASVIVNANIGTTLTGVCDDVPAIKKILNRLVPNKHAIHMDGALTGLVLPLLKQYSNFENYLTAIGGDSLSISGHKFLGIPQPCGMILTTQDLLKASYSTSKVIEYVGNIHDITISGSRAGLNVLMIHKALTTLKLDKTTQHLAFELNLCLNKARFFYKALKNIFGSDKVIYPGYFNILFPKPSQQLIKKYQLMISGTQAIICVLQNTDYVTMNHFLNDLKKELLTQGLNHELNSTTPKFNF